MKKTKAAVANGASKNATDSRSQRYEELRTILEDRRREIQSEVQSRMKDVRADTGQAGVVDDVETSESDIQDEIEFALIQMKAETLHRINEALERLEEGTYGRCFECGEEIEPRRLRALPFAVRCKDCEEAREVAAQRERVLSRRVADSASTCPSRGRRRSVPADRHPAGPACYHLPASRTCAEPAFTFCVRTRGPGPSVSFASWLERYGWPDADAQSTSRQERLYERGIRTPRG